MQALFRRVGAAIERSNPDGDFIYSLCIWGAANVRAWAKDVGNASRTSDDISPAWGRLLVNFDSACTGRSTPIPVRGTIRTCSISAPVISTPNT